MQKSHRIRTEVGTDKNIRLNINQDFDFLEILSLKLRQEDVYTRFCADYGVVAGRVITNGGYGVPNVNISIFVPLSSIDEEDEIISTLYPYKKPSDKNEDGYRYNLLPYVKEYGGHTPTGTFPDRKDLLERKEVLEVYEKYYRYTVKTNESGDFMIIGVPLGMQVIAMDLDLSNIGCFSLRPADLIRMGMGSAEQFNGPLFKSSTDLSSLPQIIFGSKDIDVTSFWGEQDLCNVGITRADFDLRDYGVEIRPQSIFMGSLFSTTDEDFLKSNCKPKKTTGKLCDLVTAPGEILAIRQTIDFDANGQPILEQFSLPEGGKIIDDEGTWLVELPMNMDYVTTNEFGDQVISNDPKVGIPTTGRYRFRIKYQNESGMENDIMRADYLVPNVREYGWLPLSANPNNNNGPATFNANQLLQQKKSYAFSLDWNDYADPTSAINCEDTFYKFNYNKVYTIANFLDRWKWGTNRNRHLGIKEINDKTCTSKVNRFPTNDAIKNFDFLFFLFNILIVLLTPTIYTIIIILHVLAFIWPILKFIINIIIWIVNVIVYGICLVVAALSSKLSKSDCKKSTITPLEGNPFKRISLPMLSYPDCEACPCDDSTLEEDTSGVNQQALATIQAANTTVLIDLGEAGNWTPNFSGCEPFDGAIDDANVYYTATRQIVTGEIDPAQRYYKVGFVKSVTTGEPTYGKFGDGITLAQSMNLANIRPRYFDTTAQNKIKVIPNPAIANPNVNYYEDTCTILLVDPGTKDQLMGKMITFNNISNINDTNITGLTIANQFNTNSITGTTNLSPTGYDKPVTYMLDNGNQVVRSIKIISDKSEKEYKIKTGVEYFQMITGMTISTLETLTNSSGLIKKYLLGSKQYDTNTSNNKSYVWLDDYANQEVLFLTRGVDPWTDKQTIKYDLSILFGQSLGTTTVEGTYYLNVPIQINTSTAGSTWSIDQQTPEKHNLSVTNTNGSLYHTPFNFNVDTTAFTSFTTTTPYYYTSTDKSTISLTHGTYDSFTMGSWLTSNLELTVQPFNNQVRHRNDVGTYDYNNIGRVDGGSFTVSSHDRFECYWISSFAPFTLPFEVGGSKARVYSPAYHTTPQTPMQITNNGKLVFRSDRLPVSDITDTVGNNSFALHQNKKFGYYLVSEDGVSVAFSISSVPYDSNNDAADAAEDANAFTSKVLQSFDCANMTALGCYQGNGTNFTVLDPCEDDDTDNNLGNPDHKRVKGGCYYLVDKPLLVSIPKDIKYFEEWKSRFRMMFAACRGVFAEMFQNNWVNGTLYMFSFKKKTIYNIVGQPKKYKFCGTMDSTAREGQGPIIYTEGTTNSLFYRSTPYDGTNFLGQIPKKRSGGFGSWDFPGSYKTNERNLFFPTTIMDLGTRDQFTKEVCFNPQLESFYVNTLKSTSNQDTADILQLGIISRLINSSFWGQIAGLGDASVDRLFSRSENRLDGDIVQLFSINSEYGVAAFSEDEYDGVNDLYVSTDSNGDSLVGIFFSSETANRKVLSPGITTLGPGLTNYFGYPDTQEVPMYKWKSEDTSTVFGNQDNDWATDLDVSNLKMYSTKYQGMDFTQTDYFWADNGPNLGYIYNYQANGVDPSASWPSGNADKFVVGAPNHFYFGLNKGKSAINRYITKYILNQNE
jgi:hypothetical protein